MTAQLSDLRRGGGSFGTNIDEANRFEIPDLIEPWSPSLEAAIRPLSPNTQPFSQPFETGQATSRSQVDLNLAIFPKVGSNRGREYVGSSVPLRSKLPAKETRGRQPRPVPEGSTPEAEQALKDFEAARRQRSKGLMTSEEVREFRDFAMSFPFNLMERREKDTIHARRRRAKKKAARQAKIRQGGETSTDLAETPPSSELPH